MKMTSFLEQHGFPASGSIFPVAGVRLPVFADEHPFHAEHRRDIADNWLLETAANPKLYDGEMVFQRQLDFVDGRIEGRGHMVPFSAFLYWRKTMRGPGGCHLFGLPLVMSADGALIAIRMGRHTANPGRVYCPAGSMDRHDVIDGACDVDFNMRREVLEETGLDLDHAVARSGWLATQAMNTVTVMRRFDFDLSAGEILARIAAHVAADPEPEIEEAIAIYDPDPSAHDYAFFMPTVLNWLFKGKTSG